MNAKQIFEIISAAQFNMAKSRTTCNNIYIQIADDYFAQISHLVEPKSTDGIGGKIWADMNGKGMYNEYSSKQLWCVAFAFQNLNQ